MNGLERYLNVLKGERADILPRLPILMAFAARFIHSNYGAFASDYRVLVEANLKCAEHFGFDQLSAISDPYRETEGFGARIEFVRDGVPRCAEPPLAASKDLARLRRPDPQSSVRMRDRLRAVETFREKAGGRYSILGWVEGPAAEAADLRGVSTFLLDLLDDPDFAGRLMARCTQTGIAFARAQIEAGAESIGVGDAIASQVSAAHYRELIFPHEKRLVEAVHEAGAFVRLHICGKIGHLLPHLAGLGCEIVDLDWQVEMAAARRILGPDTVLVGNLDPVKDVRHGRPERIRARLREIYEEVGNRCMVGAGCEIPEGTPHENLEALCAPLTYR